MWSLRTAVLYTYDRIVPLNLSVRLWLCSVLYTNGCYELDKNETLNRQQLS